ncbi:hypothetical protein LJC56_00455 [Christensenellaceae bacterium OttesenSCG-928-K19]|nr:hypothetical protein [Christensenellaceae bacterium OttesenSCG-928-K19]
MDNDKARLLHQYALEYRLSEFHTLFGEYTAGQEAQNLLDAYLLQAQLKLFTADETIYDDLKQAEEIGGKARFPCLCLGWLPQDPNTFVVFNKDPGSLKRFLNVLPDSAALLRQWYGEPGYGMACQIRSEILYFTGNFEEAVLLAKEQYLRTEDCVSMLIAGYILYRCYLAMDKSEDAKETLLRIIRLVKENPDHPTCKKVYKTIRSWSNLTTGWSGDTPRYHHTPDGYVLPVLEDRAAEILKGISRLGPTEEPFVEYAALNYKEIYTARLLYVDIFHAVYQFRAGKKAQAEKHFTKAYHVAEATGIVMPFVEYGEQIIPLIESLAGKKYATGWMEQIIDLARRYEESLEHFRD